MKRTGLIVLAILIFCFPLLSCLKDEEDPAISAIKTEITTLKNTVTTLTNNQAATDKKATDANTNATAALNKANQVTTPDLSPYAKKTEVPKSFYDYVDSLTSEQVATLRTKLGINSSSGSSSGSGSTTPVTGQVSYAIVNQQQWYTFNTQGIIAIQITNGKSDSRYIRPQITLNTYPAGTIADLENSTCVVTSNSQGQPPVVFGSAGSGTMVTTKDTCQQILFIPTSGGMSAGQYLLASGQAMTIYITITITPSYPGLWTITASGTDTSMTGT